MSETNFDLDDILGDAASLDAFFHKLKQNRLKRHNPYVVDIIRAFSAYPKGVHNSWIVKSMKERRESFGLDIPSNFDAAVRSCYNRYSIDNSAWRRAGAIEAEGIFFSPDGKGSGYWAMNREKARAWILQLRGGESR